MVAELQKRSDVARGRAFQILGGTKVCWISVKGDKEGTEALKCNSETQKGGDYMEYRNSHLRLVADSAY